MAYLLGVINKTTNKYENIIDVNKAYKYKCVGCAGDLILRKGEKKFQSFIHKNPNGCEYFKNPTQTQLLSDAKLFLKKLLETNSVDIFGRCKICQMTIKIDIPEYDSTKSIRLDYGFENDTLDLGYLDSENKIICGFELYELEPSKQAEYQIHMNQLIHTQTRNFATQKLELICTKRDYCKNCIKYK